MKDQTNEESKGKVLHKADEDQTNKESKRKVLHKADEGPN
jgi:hypothetical protein